MTKVERVDRIDEVARHKRFGSESAVRPSSLLSVAAAMLFLASTVAGCGSSGDHGTAGPASSSTAAASAVSTSAPAPNVAAACSARVRFSALVPPGSDPDAPDPAPQQMKDWASSVAPAFDVFAANAPVDLAPQVQVVRDELDAAKQGKRLDTLDPAAKAADTAIDEFVFDKCGFQTLDVVCTEGSYGPIAATLQPGPVAIKFSMTGASARAAFVLLVVRLHDGAQVSVKDLSSPDLDVANVGDIVTGVLPNGDQPGYGTADLSSGRYALQSPLGQPPDFPGGATAAEFSVH